MLWTRAAHAPLYCPLGSGCDIVQSSRFAAVFGIPVSLLGVLFYTALLLLAARPLPPARRVTLALPLAAAGLGASLVFTIVQQTAIRATCSLCIVSALLTAAIAILVWREPRRGDWRLWTATAVAPLVAALFLIAGYTASRPPTAEQLYAEGLARHLTAIGAKFYGAYWCPHCTNQKEMFGRAAALLPYIECDPRSPIGQPQVCAAAQIRAYPTWEINGRRFEGELSLRQLAELSGYRPPP